MSAVVVVIGLGLCLGLGLGGCQKGVTPEALATGSSPAAPAGGSAAPAVAIARPAPARPAPPPPSAAPGKAMTASADVAVPRPEQPAAPAPLAAPAPITLPKSPDTRLRRTTRPLARKQLERLAAIEHEGFERQERGTTDDTTELRHTTVARPKLGVTIKIDTCTVAPASKARRARGRRRPVPPDPRACLPMKLERWQARGEQLKQFLSKDLVDRPDTQFEVGTRNLWGATAIYTYQLGHFFGTDDRGQPVGAYSDAYVLYYNDGVNRIQVIASYLDDAVSREQLVAIAPREDLEKLAVAFARFYLHAWR
jgi:hypothetical protein